MHFMYRRKSGYRLIHDWIKAGLLEKIGIVKCCVERKTKRVEQDYHPAFMPDNAIEAEETGESHPMDGAPIIRAVTLKRLRPSSAITTFRWRSSALLRTHAISIALFISATSLKRACPILWRWASTARTGRERSGQQPDVLRARQCSRRWPQSYFGALDRDGPLRKVWLREEYVLFDLNGDGLPSGCVFTASAAQILRLRRLITSPFEYWCPTRCRGASSASRWPTRRWTSSASTRCLSAMLWTASINRLRRERSSVKTAIGDHTLDDLLTVRPGRVVRFAGQMPPIPRIGNDVSQVAFANPRLQSSSSARARTGITRLNKGVDEDTLNDTAKVRPS
jgi:hypothetical protein